MIFLLKLFILSSSLNPSDIHRYDHVQEYRTIPIIEVDIKVKNERPNNVTTRSETLNISGGSKMKAKNKTSDDTTKIKVAMTRTILSKPFEMFSFIIPPPGDKIILLLQRKSMIF